VPNWKVFEAVIKIELYCFQGKSSDLKGLFACQRNISERLMAFKKHATIKETLVSEFDE
jgi:hypothetical protein